jgi:hypothetical protein
MDGRKITFFRPSASACAIPDEEKLDAVVSALFEFGGSGQHRIKAVGTSVRPGEPRHEIARLDARHINAPAQPRMEDVEIAAIGNQRHRMAIG